MSRGTYDSREETGFDDTEGKSESDHTGQVVDGGDNDGDGSPGDHDGGEEDCGLGTGEKHV